MVWVPGLASGTPHPSVSGPETQSASQGVATKEESMTSFKTVAGNVSLRNSGPVKLTGYAFNKATRTIEASCSDGYVRLCRIDNCESLEYARNLWSAIKLCLVLDKTLVFQAAGNNNPNRWFCMIEPVMSEEEIHGDMSLEAWMS